MLSLLLASTVTYLEPGQWAVRLLAHTGYLDVQRVMK